MPFSLFLCGLSPYTINIPRQDAPTPPPSPDMLYPNPDPAKLLRRSAFALVLLLLPTALVLSMGPRFAPALSGDGDITDWPMSRHDARRSGATPLELPAQLHLHWSRQLPRLSPTWPDQPKLSLDAAYDPIVADDTLFLASSRTDSITAYDVTTGEQRWAFTADGPFRFAPAWWDGKLYAACDDGYLYCLNADDGKLVWKFRGAPADRKLLGNGRLISVWPARGAPVVADGTVYFAASIWPFMGVFLYALDAHTGHVVWANSGDGSIYIKQPHNVDAFAGIAPQGPMAVVGDKLLVPGGRSVPACYDRRTGRLIHYRLAENNRKGGGPDVAVTEEFFVNGNALFKLDNGEHLGTVGDLAVVDPHVLYSSASGKVQAVDLRLPPEKQPVSSLLSKLSLWSPPTQAAVPLSDALSLMRAGS